MADPRFEGAHDIRIPKINGYYSLEGISFLSGGTSTSDFVTTAVANTSFLKFYNSTTATSGDTRGMYMRLRFLGAGTGAGEAIRAYTEVGAALTGGSSNGIHATVSLLAAGSQSGQSAGIRTTLEAAAATKTLTGTYSALLVDSNIAAGNTVDGQKVSFVRFADVGAVAMPYVFDFNSLTAADTAAAIQADTGAVGSIYGYARVLCPGGAVGYLVIYSSHS